MPATNFFHSFRRDRIEKEGHGARGADAMGTNACKVITLPPQIEADCSMVEDFGECRRGKVVIKMIKTEESLCLPVDI